MSATLRNWRRCVGWVSSIQHGGVAERLGKSAAHGVGGSKNIPCSGVRESNGMDTSRCARRVGQKYIGNEKPNWQRLREV
jgi:hypothetical protein